MSAPDINTDAFRTYLRENSNTWWIKEMFKGCAYFSVKRWRS